ncbi:MAG: hypothetical protein WAP35_05715 [Solirubrobacterales bacterium]
MRNSLASAKTFFLTIAAMAMLFAVVTTASAVSGDRNDDGIPDRWAKKHGLKASKNQANRDQDRDRVRNLCEYEAGLDPRDKNSDNDRRVDSREDSDKDGMVNLVESEVESDCDDADSDDDGQDDGDEVSGYVHSLENDVLKIRMVDGTILSAPVTEHTYVHCEQDDFIKPKPEEEEPPEEAEPVESESVKAAQGDGSYDNGCGLEALTPGRVVKAFYIEDGDFVKVKLLS